MPSKDKKSKDKSSKGKSKDKSRDAKTEDAKTATVAVATPATNDELKAAGFSFDAKQKYMLVIQPDNLILRNVPGAVLEKYAPFLDGTYMKICKSRLEKFRKSHPELKDVKDEKVFKNANLFPAYEELVKSMEKELDQYLVDDLCGVIDLKDEKLFIGSTHW